MEHSREALGVKLVAFNCVSNTSVSNLKTLMIIKTKTLDCKVIRKKERNHIIIVNCKFANGWLSDPLVFSVRLIAQEVIKSYYHNGLEVQC